MIPVLLAAIIIATAADGALFERKQALISLPKSNGAWLIIFQPTPADWKDAK